MSAMPAFNDDAATFEDLLDLPEKPKHELIDGVIYAQAAAIPSHQNAASALGTQLRSLFHKRAGSDEAPGGWVILQEVELHLGKDALIPDFSGWRRERLPALPPTYYIEVAPDWVCEVLSPGTERFDRGRKMRIYARSGVKHYWLVDVEEQLLEVYRLEGQLYVPVITVQGDMVGRYEPFDSAELQLRPLWKLFADGD